MPLYLGLAVTAPAGLTATRIPVATASAALANSNFTASGNALDLFASGALSFGAGNATSITAGNSANTLWDARAQQFLVRQQVVATGTPQGALVVTPAAHTGLTNAEFFNINIASASQQLAGGGATIATMRNMVVQAPTYTGVAAQTITDAVTLEVIAAPIAGTNVTISNPYALRATGNVKFTSGSAAGVAGVDDTTGSYLRYSSNQFKITSLGMALDMAAVSTGTARALWVTGAAYTNLTASTESINVNFNLSQIKTWAAGAITTQREVVVQAPTYAFASASTITAAAAFAISGPPVAGANATLTASYPFWVQSGTSRFDGPINTSVDNTYGFGSAATRWSSIYGVALFGNSLEVSSGTALTIGAATANTITLGRGTATTVNSTIGAFTVTQGALASLGSTPALKVIGGAHTTMTASTEITDVFINIARTLQWATGAIATQRAVRIDAPTYAFVGASTITTASTVSIAGPPIAGTNATLTNAYALNLEAGNLGLAPAAVIKNSSQGATNTVGLLLAPNVADGASSVAFDINTGTALANATSSFFRIRNNGTTLLNVRPSSTDGVRFIDGGASSSYVQLSSTTGSFLGFGASTNFFAGNGNITMNDGTGTIGLTGGNITLTAFQVNPDADGTRDLGSVNGTASIRWRAFGAKRVIQNTQTMAHSTAPAFDATAGNVIHIGPVTAGISAPTMVAGSAGERCTIVFLKDGTGNTYSISGWGTNTRTAGIVNFTSGASSLVTMSFVWDDRLATPAWVETSRAAFN